MQMILGLQVSNNGELKPQKTQEPCLSSVSLLFGKQGDGLRLQQKGGNQSKEDE